jgi:hypothetical protein
VGLDDAGAGGRLRSVSKSVVGLAYGIALAAGNVPPPEDTSRARDGPIAVAPLRFSVA